MAEISLPAEAVFPGLVERVVVTDAGPEAAAELKVELKIRLGRNRPGSELVEYEWEKFLEYVAGGRSERTAAGLVGVVYADVGVRRGRDPAFASALSDAHSRRIGQVEDRYFDGVTRPNERGDFNSRAQLEWLSCHAPESYRFRTDGMVGVERNNSAGDDAKPSLSLSAAQRKALLGLVEQVLRIGPDAESPPEEKDVTPRHRASRRQIPERLASDDLGEALDADEQR